jgi:hypothetical protein
MLFKSLEILCILLHLTASLPKNDPPESILKHHRMSYGQIVERNKQLQTANPNKQHHPKNVKHKDGRFFGKSMPCKSFLGY